MVDHSHKLKLLLHAFTLALKDATGAEAVDLTYDERIHGEIDVVLKLTAEGENWIIPVELKQQAYPRDMRQAVWNLDGFKARSKDGLPVVPMVVAERLSPGARDELKLRGIGYFDASGSLYLRHERWLINIEKPQQSVREPGARELFTGAREKVIHALLEMKGEWFSGAQLAGFCGTSEYTVSMVIQELEKREWITTAREGREIRRKLVKPGLLLDAWAQAWQKEKQKQTYWYRFCANPKLLLTDIAWAAMQEKVPGDWAFTGAIAANFVSPLLTSVDIAQVIVTPDSIDGFAQALGLKPADKGFNVVLIERSGAAMLFRREHEGAWFASPFIQYLDLLDGRGRNKELAAQLRADLLRV